MPRKDANDKRDVANLQRYTSHWATDSSADTATHTSSRLTHYTAVVNAYYDGATQLYEYGWGQSFHFSRFFKGEPFAQAIARHEHYLAAKIGISDGMKVLDVGCGVGGPAREITRFTNAHITGINNNAYQVSKAQDYAARLGLSNNLEFVQGDFTKLAEKFGENSFDAVYAIEATVHAPTFESVYGEIFKVLKPGGVFGVYEWVMTNEWDPSIPEHKKIAHGIEIGDGIPEMRNAHAARSALKIVGFEIELEEDLADKGDDIPWYYPLEGDLKKAQTWWDVITVARISWLGRHITQAAVTMFELVGIVPPGTKQVGASLEIAASALVQGGQTKLFTPMLLFVCRKPKNSHN